MILRGRSKVADNVKNKSSKTMEEQILKIGTHLKEETISENEARNALLLLLGVRQQSELLFAFCTYLEETTNIKPFIYKDRIVNRFIEGK
jgi:hypothetical protein